jgi:hypothetical protein
MIYDNADLIQFQRSRDRLVEILYHVKTKGTADEETMSYVKTLEVSIGKLDRKIGEFKLSRQIKNSASAGGFLY